MGFLSATGDLGEKSLKFVDDSSLTDIISFTQMPAEYIESEDENAARLPGHEIRVIMDVVDPKANSLDVIGIKRIELASFFSGEEDDRDKKNRYLYRDPVSPAAKWRYTPVYKLGRGVSDGRKELLGKEGDWGKNKDSRFYKLYDSLLLAFEERNVFSKGSVDRLMAALVEKVDELAGKWSDKRRSYLLIFGLEDSEGHFLYPGDIPIFVEHFLSRFDETIAPKAGGRGKEKAHCGLCRKEIEAPINLDQVFAFATFDKKSFLPGLDSSDAGLAKVFPICRDCYRLLSEGRNVIDKKFLDARSIYGVRIYTIPELILGNYDLDKASWNTQDFFRNGLQQEEFLGRRVLRNNDGLVYHFVFWEKNQAQERLLLMVEDVPPTRLSRLSYCWKQTVSTMKFFHRRKGEKFDPEAEVEKATLLQAVNLIKTSMLGLGGKNDADVGVLKDWLLGLLGCLLRGEQVDVRRVKELIMSRVQGLCADGDWLQRYGESSARAWNVIVDFLYRVNGPEGSDME